jgi:ketosteroid isomerase-like protein
LRITLVEIGASKGAAGMKVVGLFLAAVTLSLGLHGQTKDADESKILALENAWNLAEQHKDARALDELLGDGLVYIDYDGSVMSKTEFLTSVTKPSLHPEQIVNESTTVHMYTTAAIVTGIYREKGVDKGKPYLRRGRFTDTWVYRDGLWRCVASQSTLMSP